MEACLKASRSNRHGQIRVLHRFFKNFYNTDVLLGKRSSEETVRASWHSRQARPPRPQPCLVPTWHEDFRND